MTTQTTDQIQKNGLSDQSSAVRDAMTQQLSTARSPGAAGLTLEQLMAQYARVTSTTSRALATQSSSDTSRLFDPAFVQWLTGIVTQIFSSTGQRAMSAGDLTQVRTFLDPMFVQLLTGIVNQIASSIGGSRSPAAVDRALMQMKRTYTIGKGNFEDFPTWSFWGETFVRLDNIGSLPTTVTVNDQRFHLNPTEGTKMSGKWAAFPIRVTNTSELEGALIEVTVW